MSFTAFPVPLLADKEKGQALLSRRYFLGVVGPGIVATALAARKPKRSAH